MILMLAATIGISNIPSAQGYSRRLRSPPGRFQNRRYLVQTLQSDDRANFDNLQCTGMYQKATFTQLDAVCDECYDLYKEPEIHSLCR